MIWLCEHLVDPEQLMTGATISCNVVVEQFAFRRRQFDRAEVAVYRCPTHLTEAIADSPADVIWEIRGDLVADADPVSNREADAFRECASVLAAAALELREVGMPYTAAPLAVRAQLMVERAELLEADMPPPINDSETR